MKYNWKRSPYDPRDLHYAKLAGSVAIPILPLTDLQPKCPAVYDQGQEGSCTAHALAAAVAMPYPALNPSRAFIYYNERAIEGTTDQDAGAYGRDGVKSLNTQGVCDEALFPYQAGAFRIKPPPSSYAAAAAHKISSYQALHTLDDMLHCLSSGFGFVFGFTVFSAFESAAVAASGILNMPAHGEQNLGGHEVFCVGHNIAMRRFKVRNSWGPGWGQQGYFTMPFEYLTNRKLSDDFWTIRK